MSRLSQTSVTPTLGEVISTAIQAALSEVNVCLPGKVVSYDAATQSADVQPQLQGRYETGALRTLPVIPAVPVKHPRSSGGKARVHMPIKVGDDVILVFSQRSIDGWKAKGGLVDPQDRRKFNLSDAFALVGGSAFPDAFQVTDPDAIEVVNDQGVVQIKPNGTVNLGAYSPTHSVALDDKVEARLQAIESKLNSLIGLYDGHVHPVTTAPGVSGPTTSIETTLTPSPDALGSTKVKVVT
jgi:hypothetical protein